MSNAPRKRKIEETSKNLDTWNTQKKIHVGTNVAYQEKARINDEGLKASEKNRDTAVKGWVCEKTMRSYTECIFELCGRGDGAITARYDRRLFHTPISDGPGLITHILEPIEETENQAGASNPCTEGIGGAREKAMNHVTGFERQGSEERTGGSYSAPQIREVNASPIYPGPSTIVPSKKQRPRTTKEKRSTTGLTEQYTNDPIAHSVQCYPMALTTQYQTITVQQGPHQALRYTGNNSETKQRPIMPKPAQWPTMLTTQDTYQTMGSTNNNLNAAQQQVMTPLAQYQTIPVNQAQYSKAGRPRNDPHTSQCPPLTSLTQYQAIPVNQAQYSKAGSPRNNPLTSDRPPLTPPAKYQNTSVNQAQYSKPWSLRNKTKTSQCPPLPPTSCYQTRQANQTLVRPRSAQSPLNNNLEGHPILQTLAKQRDNFGKQLKEEVTYGTVPGGVK